MDRVVVLLKGTWKANSFQLLKPVKINSSNNVLTSVTEKISENEKQEQLEESAGVKLISPKAAHARIRYPLSL